MILIYYDHHLLVMKKIMELQKSSENLQTMITQYIYGNI
jgi:hypothetical protein